MKMCLEYNLPADIADYLPMAMDPALGDFKKFMEAVEGAGQSFIQKMDEFEKILDDTLKKYQMTILELFQALAIE